MPEGTHVDLEGKKPQHSNPQRTQEELDREILEKKIDELTPVQLKRRLQLLEEKMAGLGTPISPALIEAGKSPANLGPDDEVLVDVPLAPMGEMFTINEIPYYGKCKMKLRTAKQLASMISNSYKIERERLQTRSNALDSSLLRGEGLMRIEKFNKIQEED